MKIDIGESLVYSYLRHVKHCYIVQTNWKPSGNWIPDPSSMEKSGLEFERIQKHPAFTEIFKTGFENTIKQTEIDVLGLDQDDTIYVANVTFHENGINFGAKTDTRNRVIKNLLRAYLAMRVYFPGKKHVLMYCSPRVMPNTEEILSGYFKTLRKDFADDQSSFVYLSNENFRDKVMMETLECIQEEFDTSELFLRSFKLLTIYAEETTGEGRAEEVNDVGTVGVTPLIDDLPPVSGASVPPGYISETEAIEKEPEMVVKGPEDEKEKNEILKVLNRVPKWFKRPDQTNSKILISFLNLLEKTDEVTIDQLASTCSGIPRFPGNFAQMINVAEKNHGKVFAVTGGVVTIWEPVREFIIQQYIDFKKSYYQ